MAAGMARVQVTYAVDADGILSVSAKELTTGKEQVITVKPSHGLSDEEVENMLIASLDHAEEDVEKRFLAEARVEGSRILNDLERALAAERDALPPGERAAIEAAALALRDAIAGTEARMIQAAIADLDRVTTPFAQRRMEKAIQGALSGHRVEEFG
jgi:molecular chaperone HscA